MTARERQGWVLVASLFITLFVMFGAGYNTSSLFFPELLKHFKWTSTRTAMLTSVLALSAGVGGPLVGLLLDRIEARIVMVAGAVLSAAAFLIASRAQAFPSMLFAYIILGLGISGATLLPAALIIANWFGARRGLAMALTFAGTSLGGAGMTMVGAFAIVHLGGWRSAYVTLAAPMLFVAIPLILWQVRTRPPEARSETFQASSDALPGLEVNEAFATRSFWMICSVNFFYGCLAAGTGLHLIRYLTSLHYTLEYAASMMSLVFVCASAGKLVMGTFSDRVSARVALAVNFIVAAIGLTLIFGAAGRGVLLLFVFIFGLTLGAPLILIPLLAADAMGLRRFGTIGGLSGVFQTLGAFVGPMGAGWIFDRYSSYSYAFDAFIVMAILGAIAALACLSLEVEQARLGHAQPAAA
jgi:MFS family permease